MVFTEKKKGTRYHYEVEDVFGIMKFDSSKKLNGDILDEAVSILLKKGGSAKIIRGTAKYKDGVFKYLFEKRPQWEPDDEDETPCENTHTSTKKPERGSTRIPLSRIPVLSWFLRFAAAFREAWKRSHAGVKNAETGYNRSRTGKIKN